MTRSAAVVCLREGAARPACFLVHDERGDVLAYRELARELLPGCPVYGLQPKRSDRRPILHTRLGEMVTYFVDEIRNTCAGPYVLGGAGRGGILALEIARALRALDETVSLVVLLDAPHPLASRGRAGRSLAARLSSLASTAAVEARIRAMRLCQDHDRPLPAALDPVAVSDVLRVAEREYQDPGTYEGEVLLVGASERDEASPEGHAPGWDGRASALAVVQVDARPDQLLHAPAASKVAALVGRHVARVLGTAAGSSEVLGPHEAEDERITAFVDGCSLLVVTVNYKTPQLVIDSLASLEPERAAHRDLRSVIIDNTAGEDGPVIAAEIERRGWSDWATVRIAARNGGFAYGNNLAIRSALRAASPPEYIWLLNPDTRVEPGASRALVDVLDRDPSIGLAGSCMVEGDGQVWGRAFRFPSLLGELEAATGIGALSRLLADRVVARTMGAQPEAVDWISGASMMIRRAAIEATGLFDEGYFLYYEETDFQINARRAGWRAFYVPDSRIVHMAGSSTGMTAWMQTTRRIPKYYFDSRRRYFLKNHGLAYATMTDLARITGLGTRWLVAQLRRKRGPRPTRLLRDSVRAATLLEGPKFVPRR